MRRKPRSAAAAIEFCEPRLCLSTYVVNTASDAVNPGAGLLTLRQALADANANSGADTIAFSSAVFPANNLHTIVLTQGPISFTDKSGATTITGSGSSALVISGDAQSRVFQISSGVTVSMSGLTITDGAVTSPGYNFDSPAQVASGGGVLNSGTLSLTGVTVSDNTATGGAANDIDTTAIGGDAEGAGIYSPGSLSLTDSVVSGNTATGGIGDTDVSYAYQGGNSIGGGIFAAGTLTIVNSSVLQNTAAGTGPGGNAQGGGIFCSGRLSITSTTLSSNTAMNISNGGSEADALGGAVYSTGSSTFTSDTFTSDKVLGITGWNPANYFGNVFGGAIYGTNSLSVVSSAFMGNQAIGGAGSVFNNTAGGSAYGGAIDSKGSLTISASTVSSNLAEGGPGESTGEFEASGFGGGVYAASTLSIQSSTISGNIAEGDQGNGGNTYGATGGTGAGGGVWTGGKATVITSSITGNAAIGGHGDPFGDGYGNGGSGEGGGICNSGSLTVSGSLLSGNSADGTAGVDGYNRRGGTGGDATGGGISSTGTLAVQNSTIPGNTATGGAGGTNNAGYTAANGGNAEGGGIYSAPSFSLSDSTITANTVTTGPGGVGSDGAGSGAPGVADGGGIYAGKNSVLDNSILSDNDSTSGADVYCTLSTHCANNIIGYGGGLTNGVNGNKIGVHNPDLTALGNYGGPTETMIPLSGSPAIGAGNASLVPAGITTDQRGYPRTTAKSLDIGAVQFGSAKISSTVFNDLAASGTHQTSDPGIAGFTVYLDLNRNGALDAADISIATNSSGAYSFVDVPAGTFAVDIVGQSTYRLTTPSTLPVNVTVTNGATATGPIFGETQDALISGTVINATTKALLSGWRVYIDFNDDGKWESTEPSVVTSSNGQWSFNIATPGTYEIRIVPMSKYTSTAPTGGLFTFTVGKASARIGNVFSEQAIG